MERGLQKSVGTPGTCSRATDNFQFSSCMFNAAMLARASDTLRAYMEIQKRPKKRLYEITRTLILNILGKKIAVFMIHAYERKEEVDYDALLLRIFDVSRHEYNAILRFESSPRDLDRFRPAYYVLNRNDLSSILKHLFLKFYDRQSMQELARIVEEAHGSYISTVSILDFLELKNSEFNEILNFEECLALSGVKDNGMDKRSHEIEDLIQRFLIRF